MNQRKSIYFYNRSRASFALASSITIMILVFLGLMMRLFDNNAMSGYFGAESYRLFTIDSNLLVGLCAILSIPYQLDGIRTGNYHMPRWIVYTLFVGVSGVAMTFLISVCILAPVAGFYEILLDGSNLIFHLLNPLLSILLFVFVACDHNIKFPLTFVAMAPVDIYGLIYIIMAFAIGEENGGWKDHYRFGQYIPWPLTLVLMLLISFGICTGLRLLHNRMHRKEKQIIKEDYQKAVESQYATVEEAVRALADDDKLHDPLNNDVTVPRRVIKIVMEKYHTDRSLNDLVKLYLDEFLK